MSIQATPVPVFNTRRNILCASGRLVWCPPSQHGRAGPATRPRQPGVRPCVPLWAGGQPSPARHQDADVTTARDRRNATPHGPAQLLRLRRAELDGLFVGAEAGPVPGGEYRGTLILPLDAVPLRGIAASAGSMAWRGKVFDAGARRVTNRVLLFGGRAVTAEVRSGPSRLDGRECIVLDYSRTSLIARSVRDELRLLRPGLYLGRAYWHGLRVADFALEA